MSMAELEQRIQALEATVDLLQSKMPHQNDEAAGIDSNDVISGTELPTMLGVPPKESGRLRAKITVVVDGPRDLGLSPSE